MTRSRLAVLFSAALFASACAAPASRTAVGSDATAAGGASTPESTAKTEEDPLVCETVARTGTRVAQRTCMRRSEIEKKQRAAQEGLEALQRRGTQTGNSTRG